MYYNRPDDQQEEQYQADSALRGRLYFFRLLIVIVLSLMLYRVYWLQQVQGRGFIEAARENRTARLLIDAPRGVMFDRYGESLAVNAPSFNVTITPAFLPDDDAERLAVFERLSVLTGVPVTNTLQQEALYDAADPALIEQYSDLARLYGAPVDETLDLSGAVPQLPDSIIDVYETFGFAQYLPATVRSGVPISVAQIIEQESVFLPGVRVIPEPIRNYPSGPLTSHIVGFMGPLPSEAWLDLGYQRDDRVGLSGLEVSLEPLLAGRKGERQIVQDWTGREVDQLGITVPPVAGYNLHLTLDMDLQRKTQEILLDYMEQRRGYADIDYFTGQSEYREIELGVVMALNPQTGEVLAMVNEPAFDNNRFATEIPIDYYLGLLRNEYEPFLNHAIAGQYPPGSTFKMVTVGAALQEGVVSPNRFLEAPGTITIANQFAPNDPGRAQEFVCWISLPPNFLEHGLVDAYIGIAQSCDIYMYKIAGGYAPEGIVGIGMDTLKVYANQFGYGRVQGIELPLEAPGNIPDRQWKQVNFGEPWSTGDDYNASIGQGYITSTPMQVAQMAAVIANGGFLYRPSVVHHLTDENGNFYILNENLDPVPAETAGAQFDEEGNIEFVPQVLNVLEIDREFVEVLAEGMRLVNTAEGTGWSFLRRIDEETGEFVPDFLDNFGIITAGKTGTSEFCDNISQIKGWCTEEKILNGEVLPTHSWYVGYAPYENPEIVVVAFVYYGGEGSQWSAPIVRDVMAAYFEVDQFAPEPVETEGEGEGDTAVDDSQTPSDEDNLLPPETDLLEP
ncbi:MAG: hypothetical protein KDD89_04560 [Anaerolineales bacterium]|nr:hypothetical protein [Anaerolineales bacterium]